MFSLICGIWWGGEKEDTKVKGVPLGMGDGKGKMGWK
jgi:hypothetical protein